MTPVDDLVAWLTQIWDEQEKRARLEKQLADDFFPDAVVDYQWVRFVRDIPDGMARSTSFSPGAPSPASVLARIAADRRIVERYREAMANASEKDELDPCTQAVLVALLWPLYDLASAYQDRPGFQEAWRVSE